MVDWWTEVGLATSSFLDRHGLLAAFVFLLIEEAGVPVPVPGDVLMLVLGVHARQGIVPLWQAIGVTWLGDDDRLDLPVLRQPHRRAQPGVPLRPLHPADPRASRQGGAVAQAPRLASSLPGPTGAWPADRDGGRVWCVRCALPRLLPGDERRRAALHRRVHAARLLPGRTRPRPVGEDPHPVRLARLTGAGRADPALDVSRAPGPGP